MNSALAEKNLWTAYTGILTVSRGFRSAPGNGNFVEQWRKFLLLLAPVVLVSLSLLLDISSYAPSTTLEAMSLAQPRLIVPLESAFGEMTVYRGERLKRSYTFVISRLRDGASHTKGVRIDFHRAMNSAPAAPSLLVSPHLRKRPADPTPAEWLYVPALRRVWITPDRPDDALLRNESLLYDLAAICDLSASYYQFVEANGQAPTEEERPGTASIPQQKSLFVLERVGSGYILRRTKSLEADKGRQALFFDFHEIAPGRYRPQKLSVRSDEGRTDVTFRQWMLNEAMTTLSTPTRQEMQLLQTLTE